MTTCSKLRSRLYETGIGYTSLFICFFISCTSTKDDVPSGIIQREKMIEILTDIQIAEADIQSNSIFFTDTAKTLQYGYYNFIFKKFNITAAEFKRSFDFYSMHPLMLNEMYDEVITSLSRIEAESAKKISNGPLEKDSIN